MERTGGTVGRIALLAVACLAVSATSSVAAWAPTADEVALLALANLERGSRGITPYTWNDALAEAARFHSTDVTENGCFQHDSCNGEAWWRRVQRYYPNWTALGENVAGGGSNPRTVHGGWMDSPNHRQNILGAYAEFGAGISYAPVSEGSWTFSTEDFGSRGGVNLSSIPTLPAGAVIPRLHYATQPRELIVNYFHDGGAAPRAVRAIIGSSCVNLPRIAGTAANGTYGATRTFSDLCTPVVFEAIRSDGTRHRWPEGKAVVVGVGSASVACPQFTSDVTVADCGGGPFPTPTPGPTPGPADSALDAVRLDLKPSPSTPGTGLVQLQALLPMMGDFDPTSSPISIDLALDNGEEWHRDLPSVCDGSPCLVINRNATAYRARYDSTTGLSLTRSASGRWRLRFAARAQALPSLAAGPVAVAIRIDGRVLEAAVSGEMRDEALVAR